MQASFFARSLALLSLAALYGCATTLVDSARIETLDKVAIVGFQGLNNVKDPDERKKSTTMQVVNASVDAARDMSGEEDKQLRIALNGSYDHLVEVIAKETGRNVMSRREMTRNAYYREAAMKYGRTPGFDLTTADGVIGYQLLLGMTQEERDAFMAGLGVDAFAIARVNWVTGSAQEAGWAGALPGGKRIRPAAQVEFIAWQKGSAEPVWHEKGIRGCPTQDGIEDLAGFSVSPDMGPLLTNASDLGYVALADRYRQAQASESGSVGVSMKTLTGTAKCN